MKHWRKGDRITLPERGIMPQQRATVLQVFPRSLVVRIDPEDLDPVLDAALDDGKSSPGERIVELNSEGFPEFEVEQATKAAASEFCMCNVCMLRLKMAKDMMVTILPQVFRVIERDGNQLEMKMPEPEHIAQIAFNMGDALLLKHLNDKSKHGRNR